MKKITEFLGRGISWETPIGRIHLWPFVAFGLFVLALLAYDLCVA